MSECSQSDSLIHEWKILMFAKVSLARFIYDVIDIFCFLNEKVRDLFKEKTLWNVLYIFFWRTRMVRHYNLFSLCQVLPNNRRGR